MVKILITTIQVNLVPLDLRFHFFLYLYTQSPMAGFRAFNLSFFSLLQEEEKMKQGDFFVADFSAR